MTTPILRLITHRSSAYVKPLAERGRSWKPDPITDQFRFVVRLAVACHEKEAYHDPNLKRMRPGFVVEHSCGLSLVHPSDSGELGVTEHGENDDIRQRWFITHTASGKGFGLTLNFKRATDALLMAATFAVDWTQDVETLQHNPQFRLAGETVIAAYGASFEKNTAKRRLAERERAA